MRIAFTGASSTGKTTLAKEVLALYPNLRAINVDARGLIAEQNCANVSDMSQEQYKRFQIAYIERKLSLECAESDYITERSFVDAFVYWRHHCASISDAIDDCRILDICKRGASRYDIHIHLPFGQIPFTADGYRHNSLDYHRKIDSEIKALLQKWRLKSIECVSGDLTDRIFACQQALNTCGS